MSPILRLVLVLGLLSCIGPFAIDMYLPAIPDIGRDLGASVSVMQNSLTSYFAAFGIAQLVYGPWADQAGRRTPLAAGLVIFALGAVICTFAQSGEMLAAGRFVQGLGGAAVMVIPRAIIRDTATGHDATRMMAAVMLVVSVSPMLAPMAGTIVLAVADWRVIFATLCVFALVLLALVKWALPESLDPAQRQPMQVGAMWRGAKTLLSDKVFLALTLVGGFSSGSFYVFVASAPYVYTETFQLTGTQFSIAFAVNAIGFFLFSQFAAGLSKRFGAVPLVRWSSTAFMVVTVGSLALALAGYANFLTVAAGLFVNNAVLGLVIPTAMVLALEPHGKIAGLASSMGGAIQMLVGGAMIMLTAPFFDNSALPMLAAIAVCGVAVCVMALSLKVKKAA